MKTEAWNTATNQEMGISTKAERYFFESLLTALQLMEASREAKTCVLPNPGAKAGHSGEDQHGH